jgi:hypothetical protein
MLGVAVWRAVTAGAALLGAAGAPDGLVAVFAILAVLGFLAIALRALRR